jgi:hypothetical protein
MAVEAAVALVLEALQVRRLPDHLRLVLVTLSPSMLAVAEEAAPMTAVEAAVDIMEGEVEEDVMAVAVAEARPFL